MGELVLRANGKINIGLKIVGRREDGYHLIESVFQEIDFGDRLILKPSERFKFRVQGLEVPENEGNSCVRAYQRLSDYLGEEYPVEVLLEKVIPPGTGLGGGSSDAAAMLKGLNFLFTLGLSDEELEEIGREIGADVPFFIRGGCQYVSGIGEELQDYYYLPEDFHILLIIPDFRVSTAWAYRNYDLQRKECGNKLACFFRREVEWKLFENDFEEVIFHAYPEAGEIKVQLEKLGAKLASLSGSGSTMYGIFEDHYTARRAADYFSMRYRTILTVPIRG